MIFFGFFLVPEMRFELTSLATHASETCAYTNSATPARLYLLYPTPRLIIDNPISESGYLIP